MNIRRLLFDVDKAVERPWVRKIAEAIEKVRGVEGANITVNDIDAETVGMEITVEGDHIDYAALEAAITKAGAALHSVDRVAVGTRTVQHVPRSR